jgi:hypothetical protein
MSRDRRTLREIDDGKAGQNAAHGLPGIQLTITASRRLFWMNI